MLNPLRLGLAGGILWGLAVLFLTIVSLYTGYAFNWLSFFKEIYPGYSISGIGSIVGALYAFLDAFVGLYLLAWLYNKLTV